MVIKFREFFTCQPRPKVDIAFADYVECIPGKTGRELVIAGFSPTTVSCVRGNAKEDIATLTLEIPKALRGYLCGQSPATTS